MQNLDHEKVNKTLKIYHSLEWSLCNTAYKMVINNISNSDELKYDCRHKFMITKYQLTNPILYMGHD